ncbi:hypothetical protein EIP86_007571 [Pleurotus ostreatoroseus]|nr:hypothetical protein EIP86_007571 [Pleurotus ostreatoroseus]
MAALRPKQQPYFSTNASSTTSLLVPKPGANNAVQAAFAQGPRSTLSSSSDLADDSRYSSGATSIPPSISDKFSLSPNPHEWGANLSLNYIEEDDEIHNPDPRRDRKNDQGGHILTKRGIANLGCVVVLLLGLIALFMLKFWEHGSNGLKCRRAHSVIPGLWRAPLTTLA